MTWEVSAVNATAANTQNSFSKDMCIKCALVTFEDVCIESIAFGAYTVHGSDKKLIKSVKARAADPSEYSDILEKTPSSWSYIYSMEELYASKKSRFRTCFNIDGGAGSYYLTIRFAKSIVEWDEFSGMAWYEDEKWKKTELN